MSVAKSGVITLNTVVANQSITGLGFTPKIVIFFGVWRTSGGGDTGHNYHSFGAFDGTNQWNQAWAGEDAVGTSNVSSALFNNKIATKLDFSAGANLHEVSGFSLDEDGFTISIDLTDGIAYQLGYVAWANIDAYVGIENITTGTGTQAITGVGFQPDHVSFFPSVGTINTVVTGILASIGIDDGSNPVSINMVSRDNLVVGLVRSLQSMTYSMSMLSAVGVDTGQSYVDSFDADGFTLQKDDSFAINTQCGFIAVGGLLIKSGSAAFPVTPGISSVTGVGFHPDALWILSANLLTWDSAATEFLTQIGFTDGVAEIGIGGSQSNTTSTNNTKIFNRDVIDIISTSAVDLTRALLQSFDPDGFTLSFSKTEGNGALYGYIAILGQRIKGESALAFTTQGQIGFVEPIIGFSGVTFSQSADLNLRGELVGSASLTMGAVADLNGATSMLGSAGLSLTATSVISSTSTMIGSTTLTFDMPGDIYGTAEAEGNTTLTFGVTAKQKNIVNISGATSLDFATNGDIRIGEGTVTDITTTFDLRGTGPKQIRISDNFDYDTVAYDINDVRDIITVTGPKGIFYNNEDYDDPDINPGSNRNNLLPIYLPMDPQTGYEEPLRGNYTVKVSRKDQLSGDVFEVTLLTYNFNQDRPVIENRTVSGPYSGTLTSTDITDYGTAVYALNRTHTVEYPIQLSPVPDPIVSSAEEIVVSTIYTNKWFITINSYIEYRFGDTLRAIYDETEDFTHCVYGSCIDALAPIVDEALENYYLGIACNTGNQELAQKRLVVIDTAWHLLNVAYKNGDVEEADKQSYVIQEQAELSVEGDGTCGSDTSEEVIPCPPFTGGGTGCGCEADNGLSKVMDTIQLGGVLVKNTTISSDVYALTMAGAAAGTSYSMTMAYNTGVQIRASDVNTEGRILVNSDLVTLEHINLLTPADGRAYEIGPQGLVEQVDYSAGYVDRSLVAKEWIEASFVSSLPDEWAPYPAKNIPDPGDIFVFEDSADGFAIKKATLLDIRGTTSFLDLSDTPATYNTQQYKFLRVNQTEDGIEFHQPINFIAYDIGDQYVNATSGEKTTLAPGDRFLIEDSEAPGYEKMYVSNSNIRGIDELINLIDTPSVYAGFANYHLAVNTAADAVEFVAPDWVPITGGTFTGLVEISTSGPSWLNINKILAAGQTLITFSDDVNGQVGYVGMSSVGEFILGSSIGNTLLPSGDVDITNNLLMGKDITMQAGFTVDGVDISDFKAAYDIHTHPWSDITSTPTTLAGYGITDAMSNQPDSWVVEFTQKTSAALTDKILIEDSTDTWKKKWTIVDNFPFTGVTTFIALSDVPADYSGSGGYTLEVTPTEDGVVFVDYSVVYLGRADGSINALTEKLIPVESDIVIIEDSEDSWIQKKINIGSIQKELITEGVHFSYTFSVLTADADPGSGFLRFDNGILANVSFIYISIDTVNGIDLSTQLGYLNNLDSIYIQQNNDDQKGVLYQVTGNAIDATTYFKIPVNYQSDAGGGLPSNNQIVSLLYKEYVKELTFTQSVEEDPVADVHLDGDVTNPGNYMFYATDGLGARGWFAQLSPLLHASSHNSGGIDQLSHDLLLDYVAEEHIRWDLDGTEPIHGGRLDAAVLITTDQTVAGIKTWNDNQLFQSGVFFGASDLGIHEGATDQLYFDAGGATRLRITTVELRAASNSAFAFRFAVPTSTLPTIRPYRNDPETGIGWAGLGQLSLIADGVEALRVDELTAPGFARTWLNPDGAVGVNTGLWFGDGDSGIYESADDTVVIATAGGTRWVVSGKLQGANSTKVALAGNINATATVPVVQPDGSDADTGIGRAGADQLSLIAGGVEAARFEATKITLNGRTGIDEILMSVGVTPATEDGGLLWYNDKEYTLNISTGLGPVLQAGQETLLLIYNDLGAQIDNFASLRPKAAVGVSGVIVPTVQYTDASTWEGVEGTIMIATMDIPDGEVGFAVRFGRARGGDATGTPYGETWNPGDALFISETPGQLTNVLPQFPAYNISVGGVLNPSVFPDGQVFTSVTRSFQDTILNFWNGTIRETFEFTVTSNGTVATGHLDDSEGDGSLTYLFESGFYSVDTTSTIDIALTSGTDNVPVSNFVYILETTKALTVSTTGWPVEEHIKVSMVVLQSPTTTLADGGALRNQNYNDHLQGLDGQGHLSHITNKLRSYDAQWQTGVETTVTLATVPTPDDVWIATTSGSILQMHDQAFPSFDTETGDVFRVVNHNTTAYVQYSNVNQIIIDSLGVTLNNTSFSIVLWGVINSASEPCFLMVNVPTGSYAFGFPDNAVNDADNHSVYDIPAQYQGVGFLIARITLTYKNDEWVIYDEEPLLGKTPNTVAGGGGGGGAGVTSFLGLSDVPASYIGEAYGVVQVNAGETALEFTTTLAIDSVTVGTAASTGFYLGGGTERIYQVSTGIVRINLNTTDRWEFQTDTIRGVSVGPEIVRIAPSSTSPSFRPNQTDNDTGIGWAAADQLSLIAGGVEGVRIDEATAPGFARLWINPDGAIGVNTGLWFSDGDTGIYESATNNLRISTNGNIAIAIDSAQNVRGSTVNHWGLINELATATNPNIVPSIPDPNTGIGTAGLDQLSLIAGGVESARFQAAQITFPILGSDDTEDHFVAIDDVTGLLTKRSVASLPSGVAYGLDGEIPFMNVTNDGFSYTSNLYWNGSTFAINGNNTVIGTSLIGALQFTDFSQAVDHIETVLTDDDTHLPTSGAVFGAIGGGGAWTTVTGGINYAGGFVGIGTSSPQTQLHVVGNGLFGDRTSWAHSGGNYRIQIGSNTAGTYSNFYLVGNQTAGAPVGQLAWCNVAATSSGKRIGLIMSQYDGHVNAGTMELWTADTAGTLRQRLTCLSDGNVGIGTSSPNTALHVYTANTPALTLQRDSVNGISMYLENADGGIYLGIDGNEDFGIGPDLDVGSVNTYFTILKTSGFVGIGEVAPVTHLEVSTSNANYGIKVSQHTGTGYAPASILLEATTTNTRGQGIFCYNTVADRSWFSGACYATVSDKWIIASKTDTTFDPIVAHLDNALFTVVGSTGNVGIGTTTPTSGRLQISGSSGTGIAIERTGGEASIKAAGADQYVMIDSNGTVVGLNWYTTDDVILCQGGGSVGVGTSTTVGVLTLDQSLTNYTGRGVICEDTGYTGIKLYDQTAGNLNIFNNQNTASFGNINFQTGGTPTTYMTVGHDGIIDMGLTFLTGGGLNVGASGLSYAATFSNDGNSAARQGIKIQCGLEIAQSPTGPPGSSVFVDMYDGDGDQLGYIYGDASGVSLQSVSDERLKTNITDLKRDARKIIMDLRVREFNWKYSPEAQKITGYVAQEALKVFPDMVHLDTETDNYSVAPTKLIPYLHSVIQDQEIKSTLHYKITESQGATIKRLEKRVKTLEQQLNIN